LGKKVVDESVRVGFFHVRQHRSPCRRVEQGVDLVRLSLDQFGKIVS